MNKPGLYTTANDLQRRHARDVLDEFSYEIGQMSGRCLDIGSGPGDAAVDLILPKLNTKANLVCSDISEKMVKFGKEKYKDNGRVSFFRLDIESRCLPKNLVEQFDHVTSFFCLHWCQDMRQVFGNIFKLLRPGGTSFLTFVANCSGLDAYLKLAAMPGYQPYMKDAARYIPVFQHSERPCEALKVVIEAAGFELRHLTVRNKSFNFISLNALRDFLLSLNPFLDRIPANLTEEYKNDLVNEFVKHCIILERNNNDKDEYNILLKHSVFVVYFKKNSLIT